MKLQLLLFSLLVCVTLSGCGVSTQKPTPNKEASLILSYQESFPREQSRESVATTASSTTSLDALIESHLEHHPAVVAARLSWKAASENPTIASTLPEPELGYRYMAMDTSGELSGHTISLSQMFPWFGSLGLAKEIADHQAQAAYENYLAQKVKTLSKIKSAWADYAYLHAVVEVYEKYLTLLKQIQDVIEARYRTGSALQFELLRHEIEIERTQNELVNSTQLLEPARVSLNAALGRNHHDPLSAPSKLSKLEVNIDRDELRTTLVNISPSLASLREGLKASEAAEALSKKRFYPQLMLGVEYGLGTDRRMARMDEGDRDSIGAMVGIKLPIWFQSYRAGVRQARAEREALEHELRDSTNQQYAELALLLYNLDESQRRAALFGENLKARAEEVLATTNTAYSAEKASFIDLLAAQQELLNLELSHLRALADQLKYFAELEALIGRTLTNNNSTMSKD